MLDTASANIKRLAVLMEEKHSKDPLYVTHWKSIEKGLKAIERMRFEVEGKLAGERSWTERTGRSAGSGLSLP